MFRPSRVLLAGLLVTSAACAHHHGAADQSAHPAPAPVLVRITNAHSVQIDAWAVAPGESRKLGTIPPGLARQFVIPHDLIQSGPVEIQVQGVGGGGLLSSQDILLTPGDIVEVRITVHYELMISGIKHTG